MLSITPVKIKLGKKVKPLKFLDMSDLKHGIEANSSCSGRFLLTAKSVYTISIANTVYLIIC